MKKLSKIVRAGKFDGQSEYTVLLAAYHASRATFEQAKSEYEAEKKAFQQAMKSDAHDAAALFEMHKAVKKLRFFLKISVLEKLAAKHNLKAWLAEAVKNKKSKKAVPKSETAEQTPAKAESKKSKSATEQPQIEALAMPKAEENQPKTKPVSKEKPVAAPKPAAKPAAKKSAPTAKAAAPAPKPAAKRPAKPKATPAPTAAPHAPTA